MFCLMRKASYTLFFIVVVSISGCADTSSVPVEGLQIRSAAAASCEQHGNNNDAFPVGADAFVIRLTGDGLDEPYLERVEKSGDGPYVLTGIPPAENLTMDIVACNGSTALAAGKTEGVSVVEHQKSFPPVFLTPIGGQTACVDLDDDKLTSSHAFGSAIRLDDTVFVLGGLGDYSLSQSVGVGQATDAVSTYERLTGMRETAGMKLTSARAMATTLVSGNKVRLIGGARTIKLNTPNFDLWPDGAEAPECGVELLDLDAWTSECEYATSLPAGGSGTSLSDQVAVYAGGVVPGGDYGAASDKLFIITATEVTELVMPQPRVGATVTRLSATEALVWGGNFDADPETSALLVDTEAKTVTTLQITGAEASVSMWASAVYVGEDATGGRQVLVAGGTELGSSNGTVSAPIPPSAARLALLTVGAEDVLVQGVSMESEQSARFKRVAASLVDAGTGEFWLLGGVTSYSKDEAVCPDVATGGCFPETMTRFSISGTEPSLQLSQQSMGGMSVGPLGAIPVDLGDESSLVIGGLRSAGVDALDKNAELVRYGSSVSGLCNSVTN